MKIMQTVYNKFKNSLIVKQQCGPVQNGQCKKSCEIKGKWL